MVELVMKEVHDEELGKRYIHFYIQLENGARIQVRNAFRDDFGKLRLIAKKVND